MSNIKTTHLGGDSASKPSLASGHHKEQTPGNANGTPASKMSWKGSSMNADKPAARKHKGE